MNETTNETQLSFWPEPSSKTSEQIAKSNINHYTLLYDIASACNKVCRENISNTPDFILAQYLLKCLEAYEQASLAREKWYGKSLHI